MSKSIVTITSVAIHIPTENPCFGEGVIEMKLEDEAGGCFVELRQEGRGPIRINPDEMDLLAKWARRLVRQPGAAE